MQSHSKSLFHSPTAWHYFYVRDKWFVWAICTVYVFNVSALMSDNGDNYLWTEIATLYLQTQTHWGTLEGLT